MPKSITIAPVKDGAESFVSLDKAQVRLTVVYRPIDKLKALPEKELHPGAATSASARVQRERYGFHRSAAPPYLLGRRWVYDAFWKYGEESPFWQSRVLGDFPEQAEDALISLRWLEAARTRAVSISDGPLRAGVDVHHY